MIASIPIRAVALAALLTAAVLALALALTPQAGARAHSAACTHPAAAHSKHGAHACTGGTGRQGHHRGKLRAHAKTGGRRSGPAAEPQTPANGGGSQEGAQGAGGKGASGAGSSKAGSSSAAQARCEDGGAPEAVEGGENGGEEAFVCKDGSEPACASSLAPAVSSDGQQLLCEAASVNKRSN